MLIPKHNSHKTFYTFAQMDYKFDCKIPFIKGKIHIKELDCPYGPTTNNSSKRSTALLILRLK